MLPNRGSFYWLILSSFVRFRNASEGNFSPCRYRNTEKKDAPSSMEMSGFQRISGKINGFTFWALLSAEIKQYLPLAHIYPETQWNYRPEIAFSSHVKSKQHGLTVAKWSYTPKMSQIRKKGQEIWTDIVCILTAKKFILRSIEEIKKKAG